MVLGLFTPSIFTGIVSFALLVIASWCVGEGGEILGKKYDASIIGGLVIAWLNTAPETIFFIVALTSNNPRFAVGAVSGSTIVVCTVALGACLYIGSRASRTKDFELLASIRLQCIILGVSLIFPILLATFGFQIITGVLAIMYYACFLLYSLFKKKVTPEQTPTPLPTENPASGDGPMVDHVKDEEAGTVAHGDDEDSDSEGEVSIRKGVLFLVVGGFLITVFSEPFIGSVVLTAKTLEVNPILLAFFLAPIASEMPEILESISLSRRGRARSINIAFSNLIGGTITKTSFLLGILCFYGVSREYKWESPNYPISMSLIMLCASAASATGVFFKRLNATNDGVDAETEVKLRIFGCELIQEAGILLQLPQVAMATAQVLFHRFYFRRSFKSYDAKMLAMAALFCAAKVEEHPRRSRDIINVFNRIDEIRKGIKTHQPIDFTRQKYVDMKNELIRQERHLLKELGFNVFVEHAHKFIVNYLGVLALSNNKELAQLAWNYLNDSLRTIVYLKFPSEVIATAAIYMAARMLQIPLPESPAWWELFDATKAQLDEIAWHITRLYSLPSMTRYTSSTQILTGNDEPPSTGSDVPSPHAERYSDDRNGSSRGRDSRKRTRSRSRSRDDHKRRKTSRSRSPRRDSRRRSRSRDRYSREKDRGRDSRRSRSRDRNRDRDRRRSRSRSADRYRSSKRDSSRERRR